MNKKTKMMCIGALAVVAMSGAQAGTTFTGTFAKTYGAASIPLNGSTSVTYTVSNTGPGGGTPLTGLGFSDAFPAGLVVSTPPASSNTCNGSLTANAGATSMSLVGGSVGANTSCSISFNVTGTTPGVKTGTTSILSSISHSGMPAGATATLTVLAAALATAVPTLTEWGLMLLVIGIGISALRTWRRKA